MFSEIFALILYHKLSVYEVNIHTHGKDTNLCLFRRYMLLFPLEYFVFFRVIPSLLYALLIACGQQPNTTETSSCCLSSGCSAKYTFSFSGSIFLNPLCRGLFDTRFFILFYPSVYRTFYYSEHFCCFFICMSFFWYATAASFKSLLLLIFLLYHVFVLL